MRLQEPIVPSGKNVQKEEQASEATVIKTGDGGGGGGWLRYILGWWKEIGLITGRIFLHDGSFVHGFNSLLACASVVAVVYMLWRSFFPRQVYNIDGGGGDDDDDDDDDADDGAPQAGDDGALQAGDVDGDGGGEDGGPHAQADQIVPLA
jgi:hypothetical protein